MKDEDKIKLLENKKQTLQYNITNVVSAVVSFVVGWAEH